MQDYAICIHGFSQCGCFVGNAPVPKKVSSNTMYSELRSGVWPFVGSIGEQCSFSFPPSLVVSLYGGLLKRNYTEPRYASLLLINQCKLERFWATGGGFVHIWWKGISSLSTVMQVMFFNWIGLRGPPTHQPTHQPTSQPTHPPTSPPTNRQNCSPRGPSISWALPSSSKSPRPGLSQKRATFQPSPQVGPFGGFEKCQEVKPFGRFSLSWFCGLWRCCRSMSHEDLMNVLFGTCPNSQ